MPAVTFKVDMREFDRTMREYRKYSKRDPKTICDTKACFIARRATLETPKANKASITKDLGREIKSGKNAGKLRLKKGTTHNAPLAALIINKRRGKGHGLQGAAMAEAIRQMIAGRVKSIAFMKSGWLPAIRALLPLAQRRGLPRQDRSMAQTGRDKGYAVPAREDWRATTTIANTATTKRDHKGALIKYGSAPLQRAIDAEEASMRDYIERKQRESAHKAGIKTN